MKLIEEKGFIRLQNISDFDPEKIFTCGQCFRWTSGTDGSYTGVALAKAARVWTEGGDVLITGAKADYDALWRRYFDMDRDYARVRRELSGNIRLADACRYGAGIRILRQDPWEALCSFILSQCNNIPRIRGIIDRLCSLYGDPIDFEGQTLYSFPLPETLARLAEKDLMPLRCGYRAPYLLEAARAVSSGELDFETLEKADAREVKKSLLRIKGVGEKVADCVLLYGFHRLDAFPVDVWMRRAVSLYWGKDFDAGMLGRHAGIAQQYLFHYIRNGGEKAV